MANSKDGKRTQLNVSLPKDIYDWFAKLVKEDYGYAYGGGPGFSQFFKDLHRGVYKLRPANPEKRGISKTVRSVDGLRSKNNVSRGVESSFNSQLITSFLDSECVNDLALTYGPALENLSGYSRMALAAGLCQYLLEVYAFNESLIEEEDMTPLVNHVMKAGVYEQLSDKKNLLELMKNMEKELLDAGGIVTDVSSLAIGILTTLKET